MTHGILTAQPDDGVLVITLNRPHVLNALDVPAKERLGEVWAQAASDSSVRAVVLSRMASPTRRSSSTSFRGGLPRGSLPRGSLV